MCLGIPAKVRVVEDSDSPLPMGEVSLEGELRPCCFAYLPEAQVGDWVLVQNGFAMTLLDEQSAQETLAAIAEFDLLDHKKR